MIKLALFDLDHTLLDGDSDVLWCDFLIQRGVLDAAEFGARNAQMERDYKAGSVSVAAFCGFYVATLAMRTRAQWEPLRHEFIETVVVPRIGSAALALVGRHREAGNLAVLTTATNRFITEPTAAYLGIEHLIASECELDAAGDFTGRNTGTLNMREGKVERLHAWLNARGIALADCSATFYSDSANDLPLLRIVQHAVAVNPDATLAAEAARRGWPLMQLRALP